MSIETIPIRSYEKTQLEEMLPHLREMYDRQYYEEGVEDVDSMLSALEEADDEMSLDVEEWKTLMLGINSGYVTEMQGGISDSCQRPRWLSKKIAMRLNDVNAFDE